MSWNDLLVMSQENRRQAAEASSKPPTVCPIDGDILDVKADGTRNCPMGNFKWP